MWCVCVYVCVLMRVGVITTPAVRGAEFGGQKTDALITVRQENSGKMDYI